MEIHEKKEELKKHYDISRFKPFFTEDCENIISIDFENEIVYYWVSVTAYCGCCSDIEYREWDLDDYINRLSEEDYEDLLLEIKNKYYDIR